MSQGGTQAIPVDRERLWATLMELKEIGAYDEATGLRDVRPMTLPRGAGLYVRRTDSRGG